MSRTPIVGGNWKCNMRSVTDAEALLEAWLGESFDLHVAPATCCSWLPPWRESVEKAKKVEVVICPSSLHLPVVKKGLEGLGMQVAAQNVSATGLGNFTGELAVENLVDLGVQRALIGHSERRTRYGESDELMAQKVEQCQAKGMKVIFCVGEVLEERQAGKTDEVNRRQLAAIIPKVTDWDKVVIAYEPAWAIGTGKAATPEQAQEAHAAIRAHLKEAVSEDVAGRVRIQCGASVTPENCGEFLAKPDIDGFLVGLAALKPSFLDIVKALQGA